MLSHFILKRIPISISDNKIKIDAGPFLHNLLKNNKKSGFVWLAFNLLFTTNCTVLFSIAGCLSMIKTGPLHEMHSGIV
jgi:hypothetical protein